MSLKQLRVSLALWRSRYAYRLARERFWIALKRPKGVEKWSKLRLEAKTMIHLRLDQINGRKAPKEITMYDSISLDEFPPNPEAVAGYTSGNWPTFIPLVKKFPKAHHLSIAVSASHDAQCLDVEPGDATIAQAPAWVRKQHARGVKRPVVYTSLSSAQSLVGVLERNGIPRNQFQLFTAHYTFQKHRCTANCGFGFTGTAEATQWTDRSLNRNLDESLVVSKEFFQ